MIARASSYRRLGCGGWLLAVSLASLVPAGHGCAEKERPVLRMMDVSSSEYTKGYKDGMRDARKSWTDTHAGWLWMWMMEKDYRTGYERGWADGRRLEKMAKMDRPSTQ